MRELHGRDAQEDRDTGTDSGADAAGRHTGGSRRPDRFDGRTIPVGMKGTVLEARPDGSCLAEFAFAPQTADTDGDFVQGILTRDQYEIIEI
jgi:hypothetical protein